MTAQCTLNTDKGRRPARARGSQRNVLSPNTMGTSTLGSKVLQEDIPKHGQRSPQCRGHAGICQLEPLTAPGGRRESPARYPVAAATATTALNAGPAACASRFTFQGRHASRLPDGARHPAVITGTGIGPHACWRRNREASMHCRKYVAAGGVRHGSDTQWWHVSQPDLVRPCSMDRGNYQLYRHAKP